MSTYKDHYQYTPELTHDANGRVIGHAGGKLVCTHAWADYTAQRLAWLYGDEDRTAAQADDLAAWSRLGAGKVAA